MKRIVGPYIVKYGYSYQSVIYSGSPNELLGLVESISKDICNAIYVILDCTTWQSGDYPVLEQIRNALAQLVPSEYLDDLIHASLK